MIRSVTLLVVLGSAAACSTLGGASAPSTTTTARLSQTDSTAPPTTAVEPEVVSLRDGDVTDVDVLAAEMAAGATGDPEWIEIFSELRARSWLATRYPGRYDLDEIYAEEWAAENAEPLEQESLDLDVYLDEPLPVLVSVVKARELGELVELEVVLDAGRSTIRRAADDAAIGAFPGEGRHRGLFILGQSGPTERWRIHSIIELIVTDHDEAGDPDQ